MNVALNNRELLKYVFESLLIQQRQTVERACRQWQWLILRQDVRAIHLPSDFPFISFDADPTGEMAVMVFAHALDCFPQANGLGTSFNS